MTARALQSLERGVRPGVPHAVGCDAVTGSDTADHVVARFLGHAPAEPHPRGVGASAQLRFSLRHRGTPDTRTALRDVGAVPGFVGAELSAHGSGQVLAVGDSPH